MKMIYKECIVWLCLTFIFSQILISPAASEKKEAKQLINETLEDLEKSSKKILISYICEDGTEVSLDLEHYIAGVILGEMPANFETEALKAQAIASRTYAVKSMMSGTKHGKGKICGNSECCQAYIPVDADTVRNGKMEDIEKVYDAVNITSDLVLIYDGKLIEATYFSCSGGNTENAQDVWGVDFPYLKAVHSPGEEAAKHFSDTYRLTKAAFENKLGCILTEDSTACFSSALYSLGGGLKRIRISGKEYTGQQLRTIFNLPSTAMRLSLLDDQIVIETKGYGHRVGMSQHGANAMATNGSSYQEILAYYYPGTQLRKIDNLLHLH